MTRPILGAWVDFSQGSDLNWIKWGLSTCYALSHMTKVVYTEIRTVRYADIPTWTPNISLSKRQHILAITWYGQTVPH